MSQKRIVITGASGGIGRACAEHFLGQGHQVALLARREEALQAVAAGRDNALVVPCDVADPGAVATAFDTIKSAWGGLDVLFNNAGIGVPAATIDEVPTEDWLRLCNININGMFFCAQHAFRIMRHQSPQGGRIINNGSISAHVPRPGSATYTMSKHAVTGLTRSLSLDGRAFDIACGQIDIGNAHTDMADAMTRGVPQADGSVKVEPVMDVSNVVSTVAHMVSLPPEANIQFVNVMATKMPFIGRG
ncbi:3-oxoacyl-ACP reductase [Actibacterium mucosum KCTC 23349]|uniref:3-oxoacyl-ACP reductase n=1 Tax=Actibacterium mucosum KCTC 23349 TaxID=1454373 RepID=A0A037ZJI4_9RHOB|nr:SDR family oxidoreductase [Actibacterium mucosum]KAJ56268.1 3-oxoacyl-ACP reductase [Actibacterium mucosum KCTC 23349]